MVSTNPVFRAYAATYQGDGMFVATQAMANTMNILNVHTDNIANYGVPGYQKKAPVVSQFAEYLHPSDVVDKITDQRVGRIRLSGNPTDFALAKPGYFQKLDPSTGTVQLTRDGRMKLERDGTLVSLDGKSILSSAGTPIRLPSVPQNLSKQLTVESDGTLTFYDPKTGKADPLGKLSVVNPDGTVVSEPEVKQGFVEDSNVFLQQEFAGIMPLRRFFEANRQVFLIQSDSLSKMIQELGRAQ
jgi:flagellar basal body rod protein FlgG